MSSCLSKNYYLQTIHMYLINMYKQDLALNNILRLICHKTNQLTLGMPKPLNLNQFFFVFLQMQNELKRKMKNFKNWLKSDSKMDPLFYLW